MCFENIDFMSLKKKKKKSCAASGLYLYVSFTIGPSWPRIWGSGRIRPGLGQKWLLLYGLSKLAHSGPKKT